MTRRTQNDGPGQVKKLIERYQVHRIPGGCEDDPRFTSIQAVLPVDISAVYPYVNAQLTGCSYNAEGRLLDWQEPPHRVVLRPDTLSISGLPDWEVAQAAVRALVAFLNQTWEQRDQLEPRRQPWPQPTPMSVYQLLPRTNCRACGVETCFVFGLKLIAREAAPADCPALADGRTALEAMLVAPPTIITEAVGSALDE